MVAPNNFKDTLIARRSDQADTFHRSSGCYRAKSGRRSKASHLLPRHQSAQKPALCWSSKGDCDSAVTRRCRIPHHRSQDRRTYGTEDRTPVDPKAGALNAYCKASKKKRRAQQLLRRDRGPTLCGIKCCEANIYGANEALTKSPIACNGCLVGVAHRDRSWKIKTRSPFSHFALQETLAVYA